MKMTVPQEDPIHTRRRFLAATLASLAVSPALAATQTPSLHATSLERELQRIASATPAVVGIAAIHVESGRNAFVNRGIRFPMASTKKVSIAVQILTLIDQKRLTLETLFPLKDTDVYAHGSQPLSKYFHAGTSVTVRDLLTLMLTASDNNATDILLRMAGGGAAVTARVRSLGIEGFRVDRSTVTIIANLLGRTDVSDENPISPAAFLALSQTDVPKAVLDKQEAAYAADPRDTSTPEAMASLLMKLWNRQAVSAANTKLMLDIMYGCETGPGRLKGLLPPGTAVAHKTGSAGGSTNDVGIIDLPDGAGHVVAAVFTKESREADTAAREKTIAQIGRTIYDYFLLVRG